jgi:indole-3-glycerol phosphate synthase
LPQDAILYALEHDEMFNSDEVIQWESGKTINTIAAAQGISIRRRCRPRYPSEGSGDDKAVPRHILEQIIWDKEVEVSQVYTSTTCRSVDMHACISSRNALIMLLLLDAFFQ